MTYATFYLGARSCADPCVKLGTYHNAISPALSLSLSLFSLTVFIFLAGRSGMLEEGKNLIHPWQPTRQNGGNASDRRQHDILLRHAAIHLLTMGSSYWDVPLGSCKVA